MYKLREVIMQTPVHHDIKLVFNPLVDTQPVELVVYYCLESTIIFTSVTDNLSGCVYHRLVVVCGDIAVINACWLFVIDHTNHKLISWEATLR